MDGRGGMIIDLNQQGDASGEFESGQIASESMHASQGVLLASSAPQDPPIHSNSGPEAMQIAVVYRLRTNHVGGAAKFVGEAGAPLKNGSVVNCACCGKPETRRKTMICDVCGQSFHLRCLKLRESQASALDEWLCMQCTTVQGKQNWPLGRIKVQQESLAALDGSNCSSFIGQVVEAGASGRLEMSPIPPPSIVMGGIESSRMVETGLPSSSSHKENFKVQKQGKDEDTETDVAFSRKVLGTNILDEPRTRVTRLKTLCRAKEDVQADVQFSGKADAVDSVSAGENNSSFTSASALSKELDDEMEASSKDTELGQEHLQKLKDFLGQQGGTLDGDWSVSVKKRAHSEKAFDVMYFSPDRHKFRSKLEVARFLGVLDDKKEDANVREQPSYVGRTRKRDVPQEPQSSDGELTKRRKVEASNPMELQDSVGNLEHQLPFQCMDLRVEALGVVNLRPGYYDDHFVWPVGYRCSWHDGVTGSICISEVIDGGRLPPIFRVTRRSCIASDQCDNGVFSKQEHSQKPEDSGIEVCLEVTNAQAKSELNLKHVYDEDDELNMLQGALTNFLDGDLYVSLAGNEQWQDSHSVLKEKENVCPVSTALKSSSQFEGMSLKPELPNCAATSNGKKDEIGEVVVESSSPWGAWRLLAEQVVSRAARLYERGSFQLGCKHVESSLLSALGLNISNTLEGPTQGRLHDSQSFFTKLLEWMGQDRFGFNIPVIQKYFEAEKAKLELPRPPPPSGWPICEKVSADFVGDLLQIWEFLCRFADILGQKEPPSLEELEEIVAGSAQKDFDRRQNQKAMPMTSQCASRDGGLLQNEVNAAKHDGFAVQNQECVAIKRFMKSKPFSSPGSCSAALAASNIALLKIALSDLQQMVSGGGSDVALEPKRGKKKEGEAAGSVKKQSASFMPLNDLTWPEVARRYVIGLLTLTTCGENLEISIEERRKILRCIQGDGGVLCGALDGVAAIEADALLLATAEKQLSRWLPGAEDKLNLDSAVKSGPESKLSELASLEGTSRKPAWAIVLEPVRKLATNVGARIRNCVREALEMNPPDWARETLEWSISKDVYKGNASGPTKRAVLSVLEKVADEKYVSPPKAEKKVDYMVATPALVMKRCRIILRQLITSDDVRVFCNSLGGTVLGYFEKEDDNIEVPLPLVARPLDFRMIDSRLAAGSYGDLHESYAADMRQLFQNVPFVFLDREDLIKVGQELSQRFENLYEEKVIKLVSGKEEIAGLKEKNKVEVTEEKGDTTEDIDKLSLTESDEELQKAPWEEGVCKICGIDKDDDSTLLCDGCDAEYHIYCLEPPLSMIPEGNWYCPACVAREQGDSSSCPAVAEPGRTILKQLHQSRLSEDGTILSSLVRSMDGKDYWHLTGSERVQLLKFLCDKVLESAFIRDHIDQSIEMLPELQQRLRVLLIERQQASTIKGSHRMDEVPAADNMEAANRETLPKKRGRKSMKFSTPILEESSRSQNGIELFKSPTHSSHGYELDPTVGIVEGKMIERLFQSGSEPAVAMPHMCFDSKKPGLAGHAFHGQQMSRAEDLKFGVPYMELINLHSVHNVAQSQNGDIQTQNLVMDNGVQSMLGEIVEAHGSLSTAHVSIVESPAAGEQKGTSGVSQPGIPSDIHHATEIETSPLPNTQTTPGKTATELLEAEIEKVEGELMKMAARRECLGRDALGRTYWALGWAGKFPWVLAEKGSTIDSNSGAALCIDVNPMDQPAIQEWSGYWDDECMEHLLKWLKPTIATERCLKSALTKWCLLWSSKYKKEPDKQHSAKTRYVAPVLVNTKAATILSKLYGSISQPQGPGEEPSRKRGRKKKSLVDGKIYRCDCLELVWTTRIHCPCCHHTYDAVAELQGHNKGACSWRGFEDEGQALILAKAKKAKSKGQDFQPLDLSLIIKRFTIHTSNRTRILQIGCLADKGPRFTPAPPVSPLLDPSLHMAASSSISLTALSNVKTPSVDILKDKIQIADDTSQASHGPAQLKNIGPTDIHVSDSRIPEEPTTCFNKKSTTDCDDQDKDVSGSRIPEENLITNRGHSLLALLPPSQPLLVTNMWALKKIKASLLDIESLLSTDIMESSRSEPNRRRAWRSFVKSAASILELVQSLALLEQMVRASSLKGSWCNWTSLSTGFGINTLCALALRVYALDAAIKYKRSSVDPDTDDSEKPNKLGRKKKTAGQV